MPKDIGICHPMASSRSKPLQTRESGNFLDRRFNSLGFVCETIVI